MQSDQRADRFVRAMDGATPAPAPWQSAATSEPSLADGVTRFLTFDEEFFVSHDGLAGVVGLPVLDVSVIVGNADHETGRAHRPFLVAYENRHDVRHCCLPPWRRQTPPRSQLPWACPTLCEC